MCSYVVILEFSVKYSAVSKQGEKQVKAGLYMDISGLHVQLCFTTWCIDMDQQKSDTSPFTQTTAMLIVVSH